MLGDCIACTGLLFIGGLGNRHAEQMFRTTAEANGEGLDPVKHV